MQICKIFEQKNLLQVHLQIVLNLLVNGSDGKPNISLPKVNCINRSITTNKLSAPKKKK